MIKDPASELYVDHVYVYKGDLAQMMRQLGLQVSDKVRLSVLSNQRPVFRSRDQYYPIRAQYSGHVISINQSQASIQVT